MIVLRLLGINISVSIIFNFHAVLETLLLILVAYILIIIQSYILYVNVRFMSLHMILLKRVNDTKITLSEVILGLLGIIMICVGYFYQLN